MFVILLCFRTLSLFFGSNSRGPGGLSDSRENGLRFPNRYQYVPPTHITTQAKRRKSHIIKSSTAAFWWYTQLSGSCKPATIRPYIPCQVSKVEGRGG